MKNRGSIPGAMVVLGLIVGAAAPSLGASDLKKAEHAVSGTAHRASKDYHKQVKDYHVRQAHHDARKGKYGKAAHESEKAGRHATAEKKQLHQAHVKEKAVKND